MKKATRTALVCALTFSIVASSMTSCKKYDSDIDSLQQQIDANKSAIAKLEAAVNAGSTVKSVEAIENGFRITLSDGKTIDINSGLAAVPLLKDNGGYLQISHDGGKTFSDLKDKAGNKIKSSDKTVKDYVTIVDGKLVIGGSATDQAAQMVITPGDMYLVIETGGKTFTLPMAGTLTAILSPEATTFVGTLAQNVKFGGIDVTGENEYSIGDRFNIATIDVVVSPANADLSNVKAILVDAEGNPLDGVINYSNIPASDGGITGYSTNTINTGAWKMYFRLTGTAALTDNTYFVAVKSDDNTHTIVSNIAANVTANNDNTGATVSDTKIPGEGVMTIARNTGSYDRYVGARNGETLPEGIIIEKVGAREGKTFMGEFNISKASGSNLSSVDLMLQEVLLNGKYHEQLFTVTFDDAFKVSNVTAKSAAVYAYGTTTKTVDIDLTVANFDNFTAEDLAAFKTANPTITSSLYKASDVKFENALTSGNIVVSAAISNATTAPKFTLTFDDTKGVTDDYNLVIATNIASLGGNDAYKIIIPVTVTPYAAALPTAPVAKNDATTATWNEDNSVLTIVATPGSSAMSYDLATKVFTDYTNTLTVNHTATMGEIITNDKLTWFSSGTTLSIPVDNTFKATSIHKFGVSINPLKNANLATAWIEPFTVKVVSPVAKSVPAASSKEIIATNSSASTSTSVAALVLSDIDFEDAAAGTLTLDVANIALMKITAVEVDDSLTDADVKIDPADAKKLILSVDAQKKTAGADLATITYSVTDVWGKTTTGSYKVQINS